MKNLICSILGHKMEKVMEIEPENKVYLRCKRCGLKRDIITWKTTTKFKSRGV